MKVIIIGAVAGGASAATRLRRLDRDAEIILLERGEYVSYASCALPYYVGGVIAQESALSVMTPENLASRHALDVRIRQEVTAIHPDKKEVEVRNLETGATYTETYDKLVLAPGAGAIRPPFPGVDDERVFTLRTIPDTLKIDAFIQENAPKEALIVGGGYIGLEMAENLAARGLKVTVAEMADHVIGPLDADMAVDVHDQLEKQGVRLLLCNGVQSIEPSDAGLRVALDKGAVDADMVLLSIGVRPESGLAKAADLALGERGAVVVDEQMRTSDPDIYAVGDVVQTAQPVTGLHGYIPLAGPANRQGHIVADVLGGQPRSYKGTQGTALLKVFELTVGATGINETAAKAAGLAYDRVYLAPGSHAGYYPGARPIRMKVLFEKGTGRILGAQLVGPDGVDKRLDVLATAIRARMTAEDLTDLELGYAPPYSSAKDPVNIAGYLIQNILDGEVRQFHWEEVPRLRAEGASLLDARAPEEYAAGHIEGAVNIPLVELPGRLGELDKGKPQYVYCESGERSYQANRLLEKKGFSASHMAGGYRVYLAAALGCAASGS